MKKQKMLTRTMVAVLSLVGVMTTAGTAVYAAEELEPITTRAEVSTPSAPVLQISPTMRRLAMTPGMQQTSEMIVQNAGKTAFKFKVYAAPYSPVGDDYQSDFSTETDFTQISRWIKFEKTEFTLEPGKKEVIKFTIDVPKDVPAGGQYASVFAETINDRQMTGDGVSAVSRVGMIIYGKVAGETREGVEVMNFDLPTFYSSFSVPDVTATARVKNTGNTDFEAHYSFKVEPLIGATVHEDSQVQILLPSTERQIEMEWPGTPLLGVFKVHFKLSAGDVVREISTVVVVLPPWFIIIVVLLLTFLVISLIIKFKRRRQTKSKFEL